MLYVRKYVLNDSLPATQARAQFFNLIDSAYHAGHTTKIVKNGVVVAEITPGQTHKHKLGPENQETRSYGAFYYQSGS